MDGARTVEAAADGARDAPPTPDARPPSGVDAGMEPAPDYAKIAATKGELFARLPGFPEGVSYRPSDGSVLLCAPNLMRVGSDRKRFRLFTTPCLGSVGLADGSTLVAGQAGLYQVYKDGQVALLAEASEANDLSVDRAGTVYFTAGGAVHRLTPSGKHETLTANISANGIEVDPANQFIYITQPGNNQVVRFALPDDGKPLGTMELHLPGVPAADGLAFDARGNLWLALHRDRKIGIIDPVSRRELARIDVPVQTTVQNLAFGGPRNDTLFVVGGNYDANALLLKFEVATAGFHTNPGAASYKPVRMLPAISETEF